MGYGYVVYRKMIDSDGNRMQGYLAEHEEFGVRDEAYIFDTEWEAQAELESWDEWFKEHCPDDINELSVREVEWDD